MREVRGTPHVGMVRWLRRQVLPVVRPVRLHHNRQQQAAQQMFLLKAADPATNGASTANPTADGSHHNVVAATHITHDVTVTDDPFDAGELPGLKYWTGRSNPWGPPHS